MICDPIFVRSEVPVRSPYGEHLEELRWDCLFLCAYCLIAEIEAGGTDFHIDHYFPKKKFPAMLEEYWNLLYTCETCNKKKLEWYPGKPPWPEDLYIVRPDLENPSRHMEEFQAPDRSIQLRGKTRVGDFTIERLDLNRQDLRTLRKMREEDIAIDRELARNRQALLDLGIDLLPRHSRAPFRVALRVIQEADAAIREEQRALIRKWSREPRLDPPPTDARRAHDAARQKRLEELKVLGARLSPPPAS